MTAQIQGALNTVPGSICDISRPPNCQFWSSQTRATREWLGRTTYCSLKLSVPSTSFLHHRKPPPVLFPPKISFSNLPPWLPSLGSRPHGCCSTVEGISNSLASVVKTLVS